MMPIKTALSRVPRLWPEATIVCAGSGPSLTAADLEAVRPHAKIICVNDAYKLAPWADALYAADSKWWKWHKGAPDFAGLKFSITPQPTAWPGLQVLKNTGGEGLERDPGGLRTGCNSGYQAINLAVHLGAAQIVLLGYDMQGDHFFGSHPDRTRPPFAASLRAFPKLTGPLHELGIAIVNATRTTALTAFQRAPIEALFTTVPA